MKMVRWALGVTLKDRLRKKYIWGTAKKRESKVVWTCEEKGRKLLRQKSAGI